MDSDEHFGASIAHFLNGLAKATAIVIPSVAVLALWATHHLEKRARLGPEMPPAEWAAEADVGDKFEAPGLNIAYWGKPDARYSNYATRGKKKPKGIVIHYTRVKPVLWMVKYGHARDFSRGGASFGYHFYIGRDGKIVQGAPLGKRTNHIKTAKRKERTGAAPHLWSGNTIGISMVGGCDKLLRPNAWWRVTNCSGEYLSAPQLAAGVALIKALQSKFEMACEEVYGHGELQSDRDVFEGATLTRRVRANCSDKDQKIAGNS